MARVYHLAEYKAKQCGSILHLEWVGAAELLNKSVDTRNHGNLSQQFNLLQIILVKKFFVKIFLSSLNIYI